MKSLVVVVVKAPASYKTVFAMVRLMSKIQKVWHISTLKYPPALLGPARGALGKPSGLEHEDQRNHFFIVRLALVYPPRDRRIL